MRVPEIAVRYAWLACRSEPAVRLRFSGLFLLRAFCHGFGSQSKIGDRNISGKVREQEQSPALQKTEEQLSTLVESSPAAILTLNDRGVVLGANNAAHTLFQIPRGQTLVGQPIDQYLPVLSDALRLEIGPRFEPPPNARVGGATVN